MKDIFDDIPLSDPKEEYDDYLSMAEYEELRLMLMSARAAFAHEDQEIKPDPSIQKNLRALVAARKKPFAFPSFPPVHLSRILNFPIPAYRFGMALIMILLVNLFIARNSNLNTHPGTAAVYKTDTVNAKKINKPSTSALAADSEKRMYTPFNSGAIYADSIDINNPDDANTSNNTYTRAGIQFFPGEIHKTPVHRRNYSPPVIDSPEKSGSRLEDSSRWEHRLRG